jgi:hypothetical protein
LFKIAPSDPRAMAVEFNEARCCCRNIAIMAAVLEVCAQRYKFPPRDSHAAAKAGGMILDDLAVIRGVLNRLENELAHR